jgi:Peptidase A4 family
MPDKLSFGRTKVRGFPIPPLNFDPLIADRDSLFYYGYPNRPELEKSPNAYKLWVSLYARPMRRIEPVFIADERFPFYISQPITEGQKLWAGAVAGPPIGQAVEFVCGTWAITNAQIPAGAPPARIYAVSSWVGIDGWKNNTIVQTGVVQSFNDQQVGPLQVWSQWFPAGSQPVAFPVNVGDVFMATISLESPLEAIMWLFDYPQGDLSAIPTTTQFMMSGPNQNPAQGSTCEWIVEDPLNPGNVPFFLAEFQPITFSDTAGGSASPSGNIANFNAFSGGGAINMSDAQGMLMATGTVADDGSVQVTWNNYD